MTDYTKLLQKLMPDAGGEDPLRLRVGVVSAVNTNGTADVTISGTSVPGVPVLASANALSVGEVVQMLSYRGSLLILEGVQNGPSGRTGALNTTGCSTTSTSFAITDVLFGMTFIAPPSGTIQLTIQAALNNNSSTGAGVSRTTGQVRQGAVINSGTIVDTAVDGNSAVQYSYVASLNAYSHVNVNYRVLGLTPGATYNVTHMAKASAGTANLFNRRITVEPW